MYHVSKLKVDLPESNFTHSISLSALQNLPNRSEKKCTVYSVSCAGSVVTEVTRFTSKWITFNDDSLTIFLNSCFLQHLCMATKVRERLRLQVIKMQIAGLWQEVNCDLLHDVPKARPPPPSASPHKGLTASCVCTNVTCGPSYDTGLVLCTVFVTWFCLSVLSVIRWGIMIVTYSEVKTNMYVKQTSLCFVAPHSASISTFPSHISCKCFKCFHHQNMELNQSLTQHRNSLMESPWGYVY